MPIKVNKHLVASSFCNEIQKHLGNETLREVIKLNETAEYQEACATHDFCDPNQIMADVLESLGHEFDTSLLPLINDAWLLARAAEFQSAKLPPAESLKLATYKREFVDLYETDFTFVVVEHNDGTALVRPLNFPDREPTSVPWEHLRVFDEFGV